MAFFISLFENKFELLKVISDIDGLMLGIMAIFEQGHRRMANDKGRTPLYVFCASTLLVNIVLSNSFMGNNIQSVISKFNPIPYTHFSQLIKSSFDIFTFYQIIPSENNLYVFGNYSEFNDSVDFYGYQYDEKKQTNSMKKIKIHHRAYDIYFKATSLTYLNILRRCNKSAIAGWKSKLKKTQLELGGIPNMFLGKEDIFLMREGVSAKYYYDPTVVDKVRRIRDSGIADEWMNVEHRKIPPTPEYPQKLSLNGNMLVQFCLLGCGLLLAVFGLALENKSIIFLKLQNMLSRLLHYRRNIVAIPWPRFLLIPYVYHYKYI